MKPKTPRQIEASRRNMLVAQKASVIARTGTSTKQRLRKCKYCGKEFWIIESKIRDGRGKYCSRNCKGKDNCSHLHTATAYIRSGLSRRGEKNKRWIGSARSHRDQIYRCREYLMWKEKIFKRDDYVCQICGNRGGRLEIDHIKPFSWIIKENNIKNLKDALSCGELWDTNNGRVVCISCHRKTDTFGVGAWNLLGMGRLE